MALTNVDAIRQAEAAAATVISADVRATAASLEAGRRLVEVNRRIDALLEERWTVP